MKRRVLTTKGIGHIEKMSDQAEFVAQTQLLGEVGLGIDSATSVDKIEVPLDDLDVILVMCVKAGESGQKFMEENLKKISMIKNTFIPIEVDGGINSETIIKAKSSGASRFVATSFIFEENPKEQFDKLQQALFH